MRIKLFAAITALSASLACAAAEPAPETVLVKRGDTVVTVGDFLASIAKLPEDQRFSYRADVLRITTAVSALYTARVLADEARAAGIDKEPEIQRRMKLAEEQLLTQVYLDRFEKRVRKQNIVDLKLVENRRDHALFLENQSGQKMQRIDVILPTLNSQLVRASDRFFGFGGKI